MTEKPKPIPYIDCVRMTFPATDPGALAAYKKMIYPLFDFEIPPAARDAPFYSSSDICFLPDVTVSRTTSTASRFSRTLKTIARSATDQVLVVCYRSDGCFFETGGQKTPIAAGEFVFYDLSREVRIEAPATDDIGLTISRRKLETLFPVLDRAHGLTIAPCPLTRVLLGMMEQVMAIGPAMPLVEARSIADAMISLVAACLEVPGSQQAGANGNGTVSLVAIKAAIERRLTEPDLGPRTLLEEFGMTRSTLYRLFEPLGGVAAYITERRLRYAFRRMTDPLEQNLRISQLAFDLGFSHPSVFTRAFRNFFGISPKDVRALRANPEGREVLFFVSAEAQAYIHRIQTAAE